MKIAKWALVILFASPLADAAARQPQQAPPPDQSSASGQQDNSVAAAARRAQEKKKEQPKASAAHSWDNDTIPATPGGINVVGQTGEAGGAPEGAGAGQQPHAPMTPEQKAAIESNLNTAKAKLESLKTDLEIATRKYALDEQMYMGKPDYQKDKEGGAALQAEKDDIAAKQQEIADEEKQIQDLQAEAAAAAKAPSN
ncbi:MAG TPA: hypothetical protein VEJ38_01535 [Candidatus Acidoferrales bacterium]|nr:hypothetical protein [Candidatus Acidoferrales bacterium]